MLLLIIPFAFSYTAMIDEAWHELGNTMVYTPGAGLQPYTTVYPPVASSSSTSSISNVIEGKAVYGASTTCTQTTSTLVKDPDDNPRLKKYADAWSDALAAHGLVGTTWIGVMDHNGKTDDVGVSAPGRLTIIFAPCTTNFNNPIEIMYYWHGLHGFTYNNVHGGSNDFNTRMVPQSKILSESGRNFVLVFPEMPWSEGDTGNFGSRFTSDRSTAVWSNNDGLVAMHNEVMGHVREMGSANVGLISIVGHSKGGHPLQIAANNGQLADLAPGKITLSDSDYWHSSKAVWDNYARDNNVELNLLVQHQDRSSAHDPTLNTILFLSRLDDSVTSTWSASGTCDDGDWLYKQANTPGATKGEVYTVTKYPNINYYPLDMGHIDIGGMSLTFVAPSRTSYSGNCRISSGTSESVGSPSDGYMTGPVPAENSDVIESRSAHNNEHYGVIELVNMLEKTACEMAWTNTKLSLGDLSKGSGHGTGGHDIAGHASHESGRDVDTRLYAYDNGVYFQQGLLCEAKDSRCVAGSVSSKFNNPQALEANYRYIKALNTHGDVQYIGFDIEYMKLLDAYAQEKYGETAFSSNHHVRNWKNHHHHYHIRIHCPDGDTRCTN